MGRSPRRPAHLPPRFARSRSHFLARDLAETGLRLGLRLGWKLVNTREAHTAASTDRTVLLIAYHFPPLRGSSGMQRTLRFAQHLPRFGWRPIVLSIHPAAYEETAQTAGNEVPPDLLVHRAFGFNTATQLALFGRYP